MTDICIKESYRDNRRKIVIRTLVNDIADYTLKMVNFNRELPLLTINTLIINDSITIEYDVTEYVRLSDCIKNGSISIAELLQVAYSITSTLLNLKNYFLNPNNACISSDYVFYNLNSKDIELVYLPFKDELPNSYMNRKVFLLELLNILKQNGVENTLLDQTIMEIRDDITTLEIIKENLEKIKEEFTINKDTCEISREKKKKKKNFFASLIKEKSVVIKEDVETINQVQIDRATNSIGILSLVIKDGYGVNSVPLENESYLIGRLEGAVDITIKNSSVGRIHGRIEREEYYYYFIDLESKNGSYVNGDRIIPNKRYRLENGDQIRIANVTMQIKDSRGI
ncbi:MAG: DUF6382 domain-containing protein [Clostridium sp.]